MTKRKPPNYLGIVDREIERQNEADIEARTDRVWGISIWSPFWSWIVIGGYTIAVMFSCVAVYFALAGL